MQINAQKEIYKTLNKKIKKNSIVCLGSNYFYTIDFEELSSDFAIGLPVYNRSFANSPINSFDDGILECVYEMEPQKIFVNLGEYDLNSSDFSIEDFMYDYEWLLFNLHKNCKNAKIFIVSIKSSSRMASHTNKQLSRLAEETGCDYVDITDYYSERQSAVADFSKMKFYMAEIPRHIPDSKSYLRR